MSHFIPLNRTYEKSFNLFLDTFFYVGITESVSLQQPPYGSIPDENGIR